MRVTHVVKGSLTCLYLVFSQCRVKLNNWMRCCLADWRKEKKWRKKTSLTKTGTKLQCSFLITIYLGTNTHQGNLDKLWTAKIHRSILHHNIVVLWNIKIIMHSNSFKLIFLFTLIILFNFPTTKAQESHDYLNQLCSDSQTPANSTYEKNLRTFTVQEEIPNNQTISL